MNVFPAAGSIGMLARVELGERFDPTHYVECVEKGLAAAGFMQLNIRFVVEALLAIGDLDRAEHHAEMLYRVIGGRLRQALVGVAMGDVMQRRGRLDRAYEAYDAARTFAEAIGARSSLVGALIGLAEVATARGETPDAREIGRARRLCTELGLGRAHARLRRLPMPASLVAVSS